MIKHTLNNQIFNFIYNFIINNLQKYAFFFILYKLFLYFFNNIICIT